MSFLAMRYEYVSLIFNLNLLHLSTCFHLSWTCSSGVLYIPISFHLLLSFVLYLLFFSQCHLISASIDINSMVCVPHLAKSWSFKNGFYNHFCSMRFHEIHSMKSIWLLPYFVISSHLQQIFDLYLNSAFILLKSCFLQKQVSSFMCSSWNSMIKLVESYSGIILRQPTERDHVLMVYFGS